MHIDIQCGGISLIDKLTKVSVRTNGNNCAVVASVPLFFTVFFFLSICMRCSLQQSCEELFSLCNQGVLRVEGDNEWG